MAITDKQKNQQGNQTKDFRQMTNSEKVAYVLECIEDGTDWPILRQVQINRAYYMGFQWISWDSSRRTVFEPRMRSGELRLTYNKIKPAVKTLLAKLTKNRIKMDVIPDTNDDARIEAAKGANKYLKWAWNEQCIDEKSRTLKLYMLIDGFAALKVYPDKYKGEKIAEEDGNEIRTGGICTDVIELYAIRIDPSARTEEEVRWATHQIPMDVDEIFDTYGVRVAPEEIYIQPNVDFFDSVYGTTSKRFKNMAVVNEFWRKPTKKYPNGVKITTAGGELLDYSEDPGEWPFIFFPMDPVPGRVIGMGVVQDLTTPQKSYNIKRTAEARILQEMGNPMWLIPQGTIEDGEDPENVIGGNLRWNPITNNGAKPERIQGVEPGNGWQNAMERDEADMEDISGAHEISQGAAPKGVDTLGGLQLLVEQDETKLALAAHAYEEGMKKWGNKVLKIIKRYFPEEQQLKIIGDDGEVEVFSFAGADLSGGEDVDVVPGSSLPESTVVKERKVFEMWGAGMFVNPETGVPDTRKVMRMLGQNVADAYFDSTLLDENNARGENLTWEKLFGDEQTAQALMQYQQTMEQLIADVQARVQRGEFVDVNALPRPPMPELPLKLPKVREFQDHAIHIEMHNRFRKGDMYDNLPPELQAMVDEHVREHEAMMQAPMMQQQRQMMEMQASERKAKQQEGAEQHQRQMEMKRLDHEANMQREALRARSQLAGAALRGGGGVAP